jgi:hypothetical protein
MAIAGFLTIAGISSSNEIISLTKSYQEMIFARAKIDTAKDKLDSIKKEVESLSLQLPFAWMFSKAKSADLMLEEKISAFNTNTLGITAKVSQNSKCDGIEPYYNAKINITNAQNANALAVLMYFEKIGHIDSFDGQEMSFYFNINK